MRFTGQAQEVISHASESARELKHDHVDTPHILLGLLCKEDSLPVLMLRHFDITAERVRVQILQIVGPGDQTTTQTTTSPLPFTPRVVNVLELAEREARSFEDDEIGTQHILLGLTRDPGPAERVLAHFGADPEVIRTELIRLLSVPRDRPDVPGARPDDRPVVLGAATASMVSPTTQVRELLAAAIGEAAYDGRPEYDVGDLLLALSGNQHAAQVLSDLGVDPTAIRKAIELRRAQDEPPKVSPED